MVRPSPGEEHAEADKEAEPERKSCKGDAAPGTRRRLRFYGGAYRGGLPGDGYCSDGRCGRRRMPQDLERLSELHRRQEAVSGDQR